MGEWKYGVLNDVVIKGSSNISLKKISDEKGDYPVYGAKGFVKNVSFFHQEKVYLAIIKDGAGIGRVSKHPAKSSVLATMQYLLPQEGYNIDFIKYFLKNINFEKHRTGSTIPHIYFKDYKSECFPILPLLEQERIVAILDEAFAAIETATTNAERNLANAQVLFETKLQLLITQRGHGWSDRLLSEVSEEFGRGKSRHRPRNEPSLYGGPYPFIQTGDISQADHWLKGHTQTYSDLGLAQSRLWPKGTICIAIVGATVGETAILDFEACFPDSVIGIVVNKDVASIEYLEYMLQGFKSQLKEKGKGTARDNINVGTFKDQRFPFPPLEQQLEIAAKIDRLREGTRNLATIYKNKLATIASLKQSILHKAFTGKLTAENSSIEETLSEAGL